MIGLAAILGGNLGLGGEVEADLPTVVIIPVAREHGYIPSGPREIAATPVRETSTSPNGFIRSMN